MAPHNPFDTAQWIWLPQDTAIPNQYVNFRRLLHLEHPPSRGIVWISVDSDFVLFINGNEAARGQYSDYPRRKTFSEIDVAPYLHTGANTIAVLAYFKGRDFATYRSGQPGLICCLQTDEGILVSDSSWLARQSPSYRSGEMPVLTVQLGYTVCHDARLEDSWIEPDYQPDAEWLAATELGGTTSGFWQEIHPRPVPPLSVESPIPSRLVTQGSIRRASDEGSIASNMARDALQPAIWWEVFDFPDDPLHIESGYRHHAPHVADTLMSPDEQWAVLTPPSGCSNGRYVILDLGHEDVGLLTLHIKTRAGAVVDIAHGEHLDDGRVRMSIGGRNFADRFICRDGENVWTMPFRRLGLRYLELHFTDFSAPLQLNYVGIHPTVLPVIDQGSFHSSDSMANHLYTLGKRTLRLCMHEHYEDCPWREQALYAGDSRNQALYGYYALGNYDFAASSFDLLGRGIRDDGLLELTAPARVSLTIPSFTLLWITELAEHWLFSGDSSLFTSFADQIGSMLALLTTGRQDERTGLYRPPNGAGVWHLYDWMDGLAGHADPTAADQLLDGAYNLYLHEALGSYAWMLSQSGAGRQANETTVQRKALGGAIASTFWDEEHGAFATYLDGNRRFHFADLIQAQILTEGLATDHQAERMMHFLRERRGLPMTFYSLLYQALAFRDRGPQARMQMAETIDRYWQPMALAGATSFWETPGGSKDFSYAGSLCHGWSALPVYFYGAYILGIRPLEPGFLRFHISPSPGRIAYASGHIPTPSGPLFVQWERDSGGIHLIAEGPTACIPELAPYIEASVASFTWNGCTQVLPENVAVSKKG